EIASTDPFGTLVATDFVTAEYSDVLDNTPVAVCDHTQAYVNATVPQIDAIPAVDDSYAVCVKLTDDAGNVTYGKSGAVVRDTDPPTLTSLALTGVAADGYVNAVDAASSGAFATLTASGHSSAAYTDILGNAGSLVCDDMQDYLNLAIPAVNTIPAVDDDYAVCVKIADAAGNAVYGSSGIAARETVPPDFTSFSLANEASDGYLNATEVGASGDFATLVAADYTDDAYSAPLDNDPAITCNHTVSYANAAVPPLSDVPATDGDYVVCVRLADAAGNVTYGVSDVLRRDVQPPLFTALALANDAADGFVNAAESASGAAFATLTASGFSVEDYSLPLADDPSVTCDGNVSYGEAAVPPISATPAVDGPYAVCVSLSDAAGNVIYGKSDVAIRDVVAPAATAVTSTTPCCSYGESSPINVTLTLDDDVTLGGTSGDVELSLETGATDRAALLDLPLGGPTSTLSFTYTVQAGDTSADLDIHATAPQLSYTGVRMLADAAGNPLNPDLSAATSLAANAALIIDT
ncbi:MAG TPA: hypothetical protein VGF99_15820, partial [Myxococcota bacterium]